jgi:hypothetical protein
MVMGRYLNRSGADFQMAYGLVNPESTHKRFVAQYTRKAHDLEYCKQLGFELFGLIPGFHEEHSGRLLQADDLFLTPAQA